MARKPQEVLWAEQDTEKNLFYLDDDICLKASFDKWKNKMVEEITFYLANRTPTIQFEICAISDCKKFTLIHIRKNTGLTKNQKIKFTDKDFGKVKIGKKNKHLFYFKIYEGSCPNPDQINCDLPDVFPETKDGAIVIGG